jgi:3',5'-cyclic AMP phosphodiesterase CpdA
VIDGLSPDTVYCYSIVDANGPLSERIGFRTAPAPDSTAPVRFLAFGDSGGGGTDQRELAEQMYTLPYSMMIHTGDIAYDSGSIGEFEDTVFKMYAPLLSHIPFFPAAGNHEYRTLSAAPFRAVFSLPGDSGEKWYSYDWGRIHFAALDTEADYATQARWLDADLAATALPWKIVYFHKPMYSSGEHGSDTSLRNLLSPILEKHHVQLVLAGHDHDYERMIPQRGVQHIVTGGGGVGTRPVGTSAFTAFSEDVIHFVYADARPDELILHAIDATGSEFDSVIVPR